jgi:hypothetical protein
MLVAGIAVGIWSRFDPIALAPRRVPSRRPSVTMTDQPASVVTSSTDDGGRAHHPGEAEPRASGHSPAACALSAP